MRLPSLMTPANSPLRGKLLRIPIRRLTPSELFRVSVTLLAITIISVPVSAVEDNPKIELTPAPANTASNEARDLAIVIEQALGMPGIKVRVFIDKVGKKTAVLSGNLGQDAEAQKRSLAIETRARKMVPLVVDNVISLLVPEPEQRTPDPEERARAQEVTAIWSRTFSSPPVDTTQSRSEKRDGAGTPPSDSESSISAALTKDGAGIPNSNASKPANRGSSLVDTLNRFYGAPDGKPYITEQSSSVYLLRGPREMVVAMKRDLLKLDAVRPQVQLDMWTVQISGNPKSIAKNSVEIREKFNRANQAMQMVKSLLGDAAQNPQYLDTYSDDLLKDSDKGILKSIGFDPNPMRPLSLTEMLIFLGLQTAIVDDNGIPKAGKNGQTTYFQGNLSSWSSYSPKNRVARVCTLEKLQLQVAKELNNSSLLSALDEQFKNKEGKADPKKLLTSLLYAYSSNPASDRAGILQFAEAARDFRNVEGKRSILKQEEDIARLRSTAAASDRLLKAATDAFAADMQAMFLKPIFAHISNESGNINSGVVLTGQARLVVTSRQQTGINPTVTSYVETTRPKPLDINMLNGILGQSADAPSDAATPSAAGGVRALGGLLSQPQLLVLGAALNPIEPEITQVAPGVAINVRPTVLPDGGSARLQLDFNFGVQSKVINTIEDRDGRRESVPADGIVSSHVKTDLTISAFELFDVSSFSVESSYPRSRYLPVIGSIPLLGEIIKKPPKNKVTRHESLVLVNAIILPRVLDLTHFYGD